jgi:hypothetical protein
VVGKINFRAKKIGGSRKVNWWVRNFCPSVVLQPRVLDENVADLRLVVKRTPRDFKEASIGSLRRPKSLKPQKSLLSGFFKSLL